MCWRQLLWIWLVVAAASCAAPSQRRVAQECGPGGGAAMEQPTVLVSQPGQEPLTPRVVGVGPPGSGEATVPPTGQPPMEVPIGRTAEGQAAKEQANRGEAEDTTKPRARPRGPDQPSPEAGCTN